MNRAQFELAAEQALAWVPPIIRDALKNLAIIVEERPSERDLEEVGLSREDYLFGLFRGVPITHRSFFERGGELPNEIILFRGELAELRLPVADDVGLHSGQLADLADLEVALLGDLDHGPPSF